ncbi:MAG TPA: alpha-ketoglutarate-dependent dioxygenase AlkB [Gammaproteobacteria bacterium]
MPQQRELFDATGRLPAGFTYLPDFLSRAEEAPLLEALRTLPFDEARYKSWRAKRRIVSYGGQYDFDSNELVRAGPVPDFLEPLRERVAPLLGVPAAELRHVLVAEYRPGAPLGWHRDVPSFERVAGVSLAGPARMRFRPYPPGPSRRTVFALDLAPRSAYSMVGEARWKWQHAISPTKSLRYSITFRTLAPMDRKKGV